MSKRTERKKMVDAFQNSGLSADEASDLLEAVEKHNDGKGAWKELQLGLYLALILFALLFIFLAERFA